MALRALVLVWFLSFWGAANVTGLDKERWSLRLDGAARCRGELQIQRPGQNWTSVRPWFLSLRLGTSLCSALDCGSVLSVEKKNVLERNAVSMSPVCEETTLKRCFEHDTRRSDQSLELICSDSVRLVSGQTSCSGFLQIRDLSLNQTWTPVRVGALDHWGAEVLCSELGCGAPLHQGALPDLGQTFHCQGHESTLLNCRMTSFTSDAETNLHLTCSEPLRLVGGASRCEGTMEVNYRGEWRRVLSLDRWDLEAAAAVCRGLDCGFAVLTEERRGYDLSDVWDVQPRCVKSNAAVRDCVRTMAMKRNGGQFLVCSDSARLAFGQTSCSGSVQIRDQSWGQSWTSVCEGALGRQGEEVLCRELGCGPPLHQGELSPLGEMFQCEGHESALMDCPRNRTKPGTCPGPTVHITCSAPVRLAGSARCEGAVQVKHRGQWRRLWTPFNPWTVEAASAVCRGLDCGAALSTEKTRGLKKSLVWSVTINCVKRNPTVTDCVYGGESVRKGLDVVCSDYVRLDSGQTLCSGSLQIRDQSLNQSWTPVCDGALDRRGAEVLCREVDCGPPILQGELSPLSRTFHCEGNESALMDCPRNQTRTCPGPALQLTCSDMRLVGGASGCEGLVELKFGGEWGRVVPPYGFPWDVEAAGAVCRGLDCGVAVSVGERRSLRRSREWVVSSDCVKRKDVRDCARDGFTGNQGLTVVCSGHQGAPEKTQTPP